MRKSRFTEAQMIAALKEHAAGTPAKEAYGEDYAKRFEPAGL